MPLPRAILSILCFATLAQAEQQTPSATLHLEAAQARGGQLAGDRSSVRLGAAADLKEEVVWDFPAPLPPGVWRLTVAFDAALKGAKNQVIGLIGDDGLRIDCYTRDTAKGFSVVAFTTKPSHGVLYRKSAQRNQDTAAIRSVAIDRVEDPSPAESWYLCLPVVAGTVTFPVPLPPGVCKAVTAKPATLTWECAGGTLATPPATTTFAAPGSPVNRLQVAGGAERLSFERHPVPPVPAMDVPVRDLLVVEDADRGESRVLTLVGPTTGPPALAVFPGGCRHAIFTSWDDGQIMDLEVARMLKQRGFRGTFFLVRGSAMLDRVAELEAMGMEIGAHSWSHPHLHLAGPERCRAEAVGMRKLLEARTGHPVISFAYPFGYQPAWDDRGDYVLRSLEEAGYWSARTTNGASNRIDGITSPLTLGPDFHFNGGAQRITARFSELAAQEGTVFHVWGHSYELAGGGKAVLEGVLDGLAGKPDVWYTTAGELFTWRWMRTRTTITPAPAATGGPTFTIARPWLHPHLRSVPMALRVPAGTREVLWNGERKPVHDGWVDLAW